MVLWKEELQKEKKRKRKQKKGRKHREELREWNLKNEEEAMKRILERNREEENLERDRVKGKDKQAENRGRKQCCEYFQELKDWMIAMRPNR